MSDYDSDTPMANSTAGADATAADASTGAKRKRTRSKKKSAVAKTDGQQTTAAPIAEKPSTPSIQASPAVSPAVSPSASSRAVPLTNKQRRLAARTRTPEQIAADLADIAARKTQKEAAQKRKATGGDDEEESAEPARKKVKTDDGAKSAVGSAAPLAEGEKPKRKRIRSIKEEVPEPVAAKPDKPAKKEVKPAAAPTPTPAPPSDLHPNVPDGVFKIFFGGLPYTVTKEEITQYLSQCGNVWDVRIATFTNGEGRGFAHVEFEKEADVERALKLNERFWLGKKISVTLATEKPENPKMPGESEYK
jgi:hypothetical protein